MKWFVILLGVLVIVAYCDSAGAYYHAQLRRFVTRDPNGKVGVLTVERDSVSSAISEREPDPITLPTYDPMAEYSDGLNLYLYAGGNPGVRVDPTGLLFGWGYGKYCGFSRRASCPPGSGPPPDDALDAACERHDCCQASWWTCNPYHLSKCSNALCGEARDAFNFGCAQSWPWDAAKRTACRRAAWDVMFMFCLAPASIWERP